MNRLQLLFWRTLFWRTFHKCWRRFAKYGGRRDDFTPYVCPFCGAVTPSRWLVHSYGSERIATLEGVEYDTTYKAHCPKCKHLIYEC